MDAQERRDSSSENIGAIELIPASPICVHYKHMPRTWHQCVHDIGFLSHWAFPEPSRVLQQVIVESLENGRNVTIAEKGPHASPDLVLVEHLE